MLENSERYPLKDIVLEDLISSNKFVILLLALIVISAMGTIWITHKTRGLIAENGQLTLERQALEAEYLNLKLEEANDSDSTRIEAIAKLKLQMQSINNEQEVVILE